MEVRGDKIGHGSTCSFTRYRTYSFIRTWHQEYCYQATHWYARQFVPKLELTRCSLGVV